MCMWLLFICFFQLKCGVGEYGLSKDVDVAMWLQYREFHNQSPLREVCNFVIVNELLHQQFDAFKKREIFPPYTIYLETNELLALWRPLPLIHRFGQKYVTLNSSDVDELCEWVLGMREKFYQEGTKIFAPSIQTSYTSSQKDNDLSSIPTLEEKPILGYEEKKPYGGDFKGQPPIRSDVDFNDCLLVDEEIPSSSLSKLRRKQKKQMQKNLCKQTNFQVHLTDKDLEIVRTGRKLTDAHIICWL